MGINMSKVCNNPNCKQEKSITEFSKCKAHKDGLQPWCKSCMSKKSNEWRINNPNYFKDNNFKYKEKHTETNKKWRENNPDYYKNYYAKRPDSWKNFNEQNPNYTQNWRKHNPDKIKEHSKKRYNKDKDNPIFKLQNSLRSRIHLALKETKTPKRKNTLEIIGLESWDKFREHIESQWVENMSWENHGAGQNNTTWHIDHIIPISSATTEEEVYKLNHYTNLRPMWGSDNIRKSNKLL